MLRGDAAHHLGRVLRAEPGQLYELSDGHAVWLARTERVRLLEQLGATLQIENRPAERNSSLFEKVKDIFG